MGKNFIILLKKTKKFINALFFMQAKDTCW